MCCASAPAARIGTARRAAGRSTPPTRIPTGAISSTSGVGRGRGLRWRRHSTGGGGASRVLPPQRLPLGPLDGAARAPRGPGPAVCPAGSRGPPPSDARHGRRRDEPGRRRTGGGWTISASFCSAGASPCPGGGRGSSGSSWPNGPGSGTSAGSPGHPRRCASPRRPCCSDDGGVPRVPDDHDLAIAAFRHRFLADALEADGEAIGPILKAQAG
jgi:hypothetical protein